ncbi:Predicted protein [Mesomycoplasma hyopneumoniae 168]|uniref:Uncharacterized protein n=1 Tax=Mesomycoplasma hyopneumoniae (strain 168) TaxID=907287 RepID=E4QTJ1_MESH1|nr:Predicted protein [Mesomycoplasma hyopneumoniae 168]
MTTKTFMEFWCKFSTIFLILAISWGLIATSGKLFQPKKLISGLFLSLIRLWNSLIWFWKPW